MRGRLSLEPQPDQKRWVNAHEISQTIPGANDGEIVLDALVVDIVPFLKSRHRHFRVADTGYGSGEAANSDSLRLEYGRSGLVSEVEHFFLFSVFNDRGGGRCRC